MNGKRFVNRTAIAAAIFFLCATPCLMRGESGVQGPPQGRRQISTWAPPKNTRTAEDDLAGLTFTKEQQAKIDQIHQDFKSRMDTVSKDDKLNDEQKSAMLEGFQRMETGEIFKVLTPDQQKEVRKKVADRRAAEKTDSIKQAPPK